MSSSLESNLSPLRLSILSISGSLYRLLLRTTASLGKSRSNNFDMLARQTGLISFCRKNSRTVPVVKLAPLLRSYSGIGYQIEEI